MQKTVLPSPNTKNEVYNQVLDFIAKYGTDSGAFYQGVKEKGLNMRTAESINTTAKGVPGCEAARDLVRWVFTNPQGSVTQEPFTYDNKYVVPMVNAIREKGFASMEQKKVEVEFGAKKEKKAAQFIEEMKKAGTSLDQISKSLSLPVDSVPSLRFSDYSIPALGRELNLMGTVFAMKPGEMSKPIKGEQGVYVVIVEKITAAPEPKDYTQQKSSLKTNLQYRVEGSASNILRDKAEITDNRFKFN